MRIVILSFTQTGTLLNQRIGSLLQNEKIECQSYAPAKYLSGEKLYQTKPYPENPKELIKEGWGDSAFLFIGAVGIAVRYIAPYVKDKFTDSPVVVMDEKARYVIPLLSGHLGGAVELAERLAEWTGAVPVQTTATDVQGKFAVDVFAKKNQLQISDREAAKQISASVLDGRQVGLWIGEGISYDPKEISDELVLCGSEEEFMSFAETRPAIVITKTAREGRRIRERLLESVAFAAQQTGHAAILCLYPRNITAGVGCRKEILEALFEKGLDDVLDGYGLDQTQVKRLVSIDLKKDEKAILGFAQEHRIPFMTYPAEELKKVGDVSASSAFVKQVTGVDNVCERAAKLAEPDGELLCPKCVREQMTVALVEKAVSVCF